MRANANGLSEDRPICFSTLAGNNLPDFMIFMQEYPLELVAHNGNLHSDNQERVEEQNKVYGRDVA